MSSAAFLLPTKNDPCPYLKLNGPSGISSAGEVSEQRPCDRLSVSRGIDMSVLDYCFQHGLLYEAADYHNAVFVGYDGKHRATPRCAARSPAAASSAM